MKAYEVDISDFDDASKNKFIAMYSKNQQGIHYFCILLMYIVILIFYYMQLNMTLIYYQNPVQSSASEFTLMVERVNADEPIESVYDFIFKTYANTYGWQALPRIVKVNLGRADGFIYSSRNEIIEKEFTLDKVKESREEHLFVGAEKVADNEGLIKEYDKMIKSLEKEVKKLQKKAEKLESNRHKLMERNRNTIAFISFATNIEKDQVLHSYKKLFGPRWSFNCFTKKPYSKYYLTKAPEPDSINWDSVGTSERDRYINATMSTMKLYITQGFVILVYSMLRVVTMMLALLSFKLSLLTGLGFQMFMYVVIALFTKLTEKLIDYFERSSKALVTTDYLSRKSVQSALLKFFFCAFTLFTNSLGKVTEYNETSIKVFGRLLLSYAKSLMCLTPLMLIVNYGFVKNLYFRKKIENYFKKINANTEKEQEDDSSTESYKKAPEQEKKKKFSKFSCMTLGMINKYFERLKPEIDLKYSSIFFMMLYLAFSSFFSPLLLPTMIGTTIIVVGLIQLKLFYSRYKEPLYNTKRLNDSMFRRLILFPKLCYISNVVMFIKDMKNQNWSLLILFLFNFNWIFSAIKVKTEERFFNKYKKTRKRYEEYERHFLTDYDLENPATKYVARERRRKMMERINSANKVPLNDQDVSLMSVESRSET